MFQSKTKYLDSPLVSVIIPNYCHSRYLNERINSVLNQTYKKIEIIILDDCSNDNGESRSIIEQYRNNPFVTHIEYNLENSGNTFSQWNKGIILSKGELIWIAESDDSCLPNMLERLVEAYMQYDDSVIAYTSYLLANQDGLINAVNSKYPILYALRELFTSKKHFSGLEYIKRYLTVGNLIENASTAIFSKKAAMSIANEYLKYTSAGDYCFWIELSKLGSVTFLDQQLSIFRRHDGVVTAKKDADGTNFRVNKLMIDYIFNQYPFSNIRLRYCRARQIYRIKNTKFNSSDVFNGLLDMWGDNGFISVFDKLIYFIGEFLFRKFKYLI